MCVAITVPCFEMSFHSHCPSADGDPLWYQRFNSPYYKATHVAFRERVRNFVEKEVMPYVNEWRDLPTINQEIRDCYLKMGKVRRAPARL